MRTITDHKWKNFKYRYEVPPKILKELFDYLDLEDDGEDHFLKYRGNWYHLSEFVRFIVGGKWDGYTAESAFSAVVIKLSKDAEQYKIGMQLT